MAFGTGDIRNMNFEKSKKLLLRISLMYWFLFLLIYFVGYREFRVSSLATDTMSADGVVGEIVDGMELKQRYKVDFENITQASIRFATYNRKNSGTITLDIEDDSGVVLGSRKINIENIEDGEITYVSFEQPITVEKGAIVYLAISSTGSQSGNSITIYKGNAVSVGRTSIKQDIAVDDLFSINGHKGDGRICASLIGTNHTNAYIYYSVGGILFYFVVALICTILWRDAKKGNSNVLSTFCIMFTKYDFLLKQLVSRDFKTKYKRSVLGMAWSFLNPLLTMSVQYVVFSTLFKSDIPNYPVYLLSGIVLMSFFNESVSMGMTSITSNVSLIKKVYIPKYIYPISRVVSSTINFGFSLIPLFLVMVFTKTRIHASVLLLAFDILCLIGFVTGMSLLLTTAMTFFQDTQFLWGVISMMWMYLTPVFYPETIIPLEFRTLFHMNPMFQYIKFARVCIINGNSPDPWSYLWCLLSSLVVLLLGIFVFKRNQDKFIMYL